MVTCKICNKKMKQITTSGHLRIHKIDREEYLRRFPGAPTVCESTKSSHAHAMKKRVKEGTHFVPFRDIEGFARKIHDEYMTGPVEYTCIQCGKVKATNAYVANKRKFCSNKCHAKHIQDNPEQYIDRNIKISESNKGKIKLGGYSRCKGGMRADLGHYVRSGWEADVCRIFKHHKKKYDYESFTVLLDDNGQDLYWTIDLVDVQHFMSDGLVEIKGWWDEKSKKKLSLLRLQYPDLYNKLTIVDRVKMIEFIQKYSSVIKNWESNK